MIRLSPKDILCQRCNNVSCLVKEYCTDEWINKISTQKETSIYRKNQYVVQEGNEVFGLYFIQKGKVKVVSPGLGGRDQVVRLTKKGDIIGHRGLGNETYPISAITFEESTICFIDNETIYKAFLENPKLTYHLMMYYSKELRKSESKIKAHAQMNVREKVAHALISYNLLFSEQNSITIIQLNRQDISDFAGINTQQLSRILSEFKRENIISINKNEIQINDLNLLLEITQPFGVIV